MPSLFLICAKEPAKSRLLEEALRGLSEEGFAVAARSEQADWWELFSTATTGGLFEEKNIYVVDSPEAMGPLPSPLALQVEKKELASTAILLLYEGNVEKYIPRDVIKLATIKKPDKVPHWTSGRIEWIKGLIKKTGVKWEAGAISLLEEWIEDPEEIKSEIDKLTTLASDGLVTENLVKNLCVDEGSKAFLNLLDGLCEGKAELVVRSLARIKKESDVLPVVSGLHRRMRLAMYLADYKDKGEKKEDILSAFGAKPYQAKKALLASRIYSTKALRRFVSEMIKASCMNKRLSAGAWEVVEMALLALLDSKAGRPS